MGSCESQNNFNGYVKGRMGETQEEGKEYDSTLSFGFDIVECLR
jgi:hypothetical protein